MSEPKPQTLKQKIGRLLFARMPVTRFLFDQIRTEANTWWVGCQNKLVPSRRRNLRQLREARGLYVNVACGPIPLPEFVNLDLYSSEQGVVRWDCRWSLPVSNEAAAGIRVEHFFEHLEAREEVPHFLCDCYRALCPGGVLRIIVPDAGRFLQAYNHGDRGVAFSKLGFPQPFPDDLPMPMDVINHVFHQWHEHRWGYDAENLTDRLKTAGFAKVRQMSYCCSLDPRLAQDASNHALYSLYMDAVK